MSNISSIFSSATACIIFWCPFMTRHWLI
jgi:hypothetical protein